MIGLALSGGGSRAMAFHLGCLRALNDLGILNRVKALSTISGGSVIGAYYAYSPDKSFSDFESDIRIFLKEGFQKKIALRLLNPKTFCECLFSLINAHAATASARISGIEPEYERYPSRSDVFHDVLNHYVFPGLKLNSVRRHDLEIVIGACELRTGTAFRFSAERSGSWRHGPLADNDIDVAFAVAASAAYPIFLPAFDRTWLFRGDGECVRRRVLLTDGGLYDNLGLQVIEPGHESDRSLHRIPCEYLIVCNAGQGQPSGQALPLTFLPRIARSFEITHRRVQEANMHHLHHIRKARLIKGFAMPYLGQQDDRLPWTPADLVKRNEVIGYPTNFGAMSEEWIEKISDRGEQLTRLLVSYYLQDLL